MSTKDCKQPNAVNPLRIFEPTYKMPKHLAVAEGPLLRTESNKHSTIVKTKVKTMHLLCLGHLLLDECRPNELVDVVGVAEGVHHLLYHLVLVEL